MFGQPPEVDHVRLGRFIAQTATRYVKPLWWGYLTEPDGEVVANGTVFLVSSGTSIIGVTAGHVLDQCMSDLDDSDGRMIAKVGGYAFDPRRLLIATSRRPDIGTFRVPSKFVRPIDMVPVECRQADWPPELPKPNEVVFVSGFPGLERRSESPERVVFGAYSAILVTYAVSENNISLLIDHSMMEDYSGLGLPPPGYDMGGFSGAPLLRVREERAIWSWDLTGIVYEASAGLDLVKAAPAKYLDLSGEIFPWA